MPTLRYVVADVFTDTPLQGNQLAVFTDARELDGETMQALARELNYSESVFVLPPEADGHVRIRIFTPASEKTLLWKLAGSRPTRPSSNVSVWPSAWTSVDLPQ